MSRLIVILGFDGPGSAAIPTPVYVGRSGADGEAAMAADKKSVRFEILKNPVTQRKNNSKYDPSRVTAAPVKVKLDKKAAAAEKAAAEKAAAEKAAAEKAAAEKAAAEKAAAEKAAEVDGDLPPGSSESESETQENSASSAPPRETESE